MKSTSRLGLVVAAILGLASVGRASDETVNVNFLAGDNAVDIVNTLGAAWSQSPDFGCSTFSNRLTVTDLAGDCDEPFTVYKVRLPNGTLAQNHSFDFRVQCSATSPSVNLDAAGFVPLLEGPNVFVSGPDTFIIDFITPMNVPTMSEWALIVLGVSVLGAGLFVLRR